MKTYKLLKICLPSKLGQSSKKIKISRVLKTCESGHRHSILVREIDNFDEWFPSQQTVLTGILNGMIDIGTSTIGARLAVTNYGRYH